MIHFAHYRGFIYLLNPKFLSIQTSPEDVKKEVVEILQNSYPSLKEHCFENEANQRRSQYLIDKVIGAIEGLINFMWLKESNHFKKFHFYT